MITNQSTTAQLQRALLDESELSLESIEDLEKQRKKLNYHSWRWFALKWSSLIFVIGSPAGYVAAGHVADEACKKFITQHPEEKSCNLYETSPPGTFAFGCTPLPLLPFCFGVGLFSYSYDKQKKVDSTIKSIDTEIARRSHQPV